MTMKTFKQYIDGKNMTPYQFSQTNKLPNTSVWKAYKGEPIGATTANRIYLATGRKVKLMDMIFRGEDKK